MKSLHRLVFANLLACACLLAANLLHADETKHLLRYKPQAGQVLRWQIEHRAKVRTTVNGTTQTSDTSSDSVKAWKITEVTPEGQFTITHMVEKVVMREKTSGRAESIYNSESDKEPPPGFAAAAAKVGVPLTRIVLDSQGNVIKREDLAQQSTDGSTFVTLPLPKEPVAIGESWTFPHVITVQKKDRSPKQIKSVQKFTLQDVTGHIATIAVETAVLTPINDPFIEAQLVQRETHGKARFDMEAGRLLDQKLELEKRVIGHIGETSSMQFNMSFVETLLPDDSVARQSAGPKIK